METWLVDDDVTAFCRRLHPRLVGALGLYCGDPAVAEELAQEALARLWERWPKVNGLDAPEAWVFRVAFDLASSRFRRLRAERRAMRRVEPGPVSVSDTSEAVALRQAVRSLPRRQRTALVLRYFVDLPVGDAARAMGCAPGTVKALTSQAVAGLRDRLGVAVHADEGDGRHG